VCACASPVGNYAIPADSKHLVLIFGMDPSEPDELPASDRLHRNRMISGKLEPRPETRVLLVLGEGPFERDISKTLEEYLRNHLGHVLLYLREPRANNDCAAAMKEWRRSARDEEGAAEGAKVKKPKDD
jgi:hypothetical protein